METVDSLDAYMTSLEVPSDNQLMSITRERAANKTNRSIVRHSLPVIVRNRRYRQLQLLLKDTSEDRFFSDVTMQQRSPALYHFYLGQYLSSDTKAVPSVDKKAHTLSSFLIDTCDRSEMEARRVAEQETWGQFTANDKKQERIRLRHFYEVDGSEEKEEKEEDNDDEEDTTVCTINERREQLLDIMSIRFLNGEDGEYIHYADIDANETLDDFDEVQRDAEDRYFAD